MHNIVQGDMDLSIVRYCAVAYTSVIFYKVPEQHHVYLVGLYMLKPRAISNLLIETGQKRILFTPSLRRTMFVHRFVSCARFDYIFLTQTRGRCAFIYLSSARAFVYLS